MAIFSKKKAKKRSRQEAARQGYLGYKVVEGTETEQARATAAERSRLGVFGMLGQPGSFDLPGAAGAGSGASYDPTDIYDTSQKHSAGAKSLLQYSKYLTPEARKEIEEGTRKGILDPEKYSEMIGKTASFRIQSRQTAEAEQLLAGKGEAWERLSQATHGQIFEGAATQMRETMRDLKDQAAKGGTARRTALNQAREIVAKQDIAQMRVNETWKANLDLFNVVRRNADRVQNQNQSFLDNLPQVRDSYQKTMSNLADSMVASASAASAMSTAGYKARAAVGDSQFWEKLIIGTVGLVASAYGMQSSTFNSLAGDTSAVGYETRSGDDKRNLGADIKSAVNWGKGLFSKSGGDITKGGNVSTGGPAADAALAGASRTA